MELNLWPSHAHAQTHVTAHTDRYSHIHKRARPSSLIGLLNIDASTVFNFTLNVSITILCLVRTTAAYKQTQL